MICTAIHMISGLRRATKCFFDQPIKMFLLVFIHLKE